MVASRVALVTGASRGIGRQVAQAFAAAGLTVAVHYNRDKFAAETSIAALPAGRHALFAADLAAPGAPAGLVRAVLETFGHIDILVNNAAIYEDHGLGEPVEVDAWLATFERTLDVNLLAPAALSLLAVRAMREREVSGAFGRGRIVNVSSRGAFRGEIGAPGYAASKAGLNILGQSFAQALAKEAIYVFAVAPGWVETDMASSLRGPNGPAIIREHPLGRVATAEEVAGAIAWLALCAPPSATGSILDVNGASYIRT
jgi:3-oxoacyl-[acyl-carrier protein] reductase